MTATRSARPGIAVGLHALGIANSSKPEVLATVARRADEAGFGTLWCGEHVVMVDEPGSRYPYSHDGKITVPDGCSPPLDPARGRAGMARVQSAQDADQRQVAPRRLSGSANGSEGGNNS